MPVNVWDVEEVVSSLELAPPLEVHIQHWKGTGLGDITNSI